MASLPTPEQRHRPGSVREPVARRPRRAGLGQSQAGFSLAEVLVATAVFGSALISVCGLYVMARNQVHAARKTTVAATLGEDFLDEIRNMPMHAVTQLVDAQPTDQSATLSTDQANPPYAGLDAATATARAATMDAWREEAREKLPHGNVLLIAEAFRDRPTSDGTGVTTFADVRFLRLELSVSWSSSGQVRRVTYNQFKF